jgi:hypothetical protein
VRLHFQRDLVLAVGSFLRSGGDRTVVIENNAVETVVDSTFENETQTAMSTNWRPDGELFYYRQCGLDL